MELNRDELVATVLDLQETLQDLLQRVDAVKSENNRLKHENALMAGYIDSLMEHMNNSEATDSPRGKKCNQDSPRRGDHPLPGFITEILKKNQDRRRHSIEK